jgi:peptide/nickel transport system permease protein
VTAQQVQREMIAGDAERTAQQTPAPTLPLASRLRSRRRPMSASVWVGGGIVLIVAICALLPNLVAPGDPTRLNVAAKFVPPSSAHWMGTDEVGRDLWARIVYGTRYSIGMALAIVAVGSLFGVLYGAVAGFIGGKGEEVMMRIVDVFLSLPGFILAMAIAASIGRGIVPLVAALVIVWWPGYARLVRGMVLGLKERPHVEGARALGASGPYILRRHIVPLMLEQLNVRVT